MYRKLLLIALVGLSFAACKKTQRVVDHSADQPQEAPTEAATEAAPASQDASAGQPATPEGQAPQEEAVCSDCLLEVCSVTQGYNQIRPWEKEGISRSTQSAVYLGEGRVLVCSAPLRAATYVELRLPDASRTVTARVVKYDEDLGLGLLTVAHEEDISIFETRKAYPLGAPLALGDKAELWCLVGGTRPARIDLYAESASTSAAGNMPRINLKAERPITGDVYANGAPVIREGKLVGISQGYDANKQLLSCINAELIRRFLKESPEVASEGAPVLGIKLEQLSDPVFRRYLHLEEGRSGLYVSKVLPESAAEKAGICEGDVVTAVEDMPVDISGRCTHRLYGPLDAGCVAVSLKPVGQTLKLTISREGKLQDVEVSLNRDARDKALIGSNKPGVQPRYILWGGLLFMPVSEEYLQAVRAAMGGLPLPYLQMERREKELRESGVTELVTLAGAIPTPATHGYENVGGCVVEKVNGRAIHNFREFEEALDMPTPDGIVEISINRAPYTIYMDAKLAADADDVMRRTSIPHLRHTDKDDKKTP